MRRKYIGLLLIFFLSSFIFNYFFWLGPLFFKKKLISKQVIVLKEQLKAQQNDLIQYSFTRKKQMLLKQQAFFDRNGLEKYSKNVSKSQAVNCPLSHYSLINLKVVGYLVADRIDKKWGLLKLPNGQICKVEVNSEVGIEKAKVIFIDAKKIIVQEKNSKKIMN